MGWSRDTLDVDRGLTLGPITAQVCRPPARLDCGTASLQAAGDRDCVTFAACGSDQFAEVLPADAVFVRPGASDGDGSRERPFGRVALALSAGATTIALAHGHYAEAVQLDGDVDVVGACKEATTLAAGVQLRAFRGEVRGLQVVGEVTIERSEAELRDVALAGTPSGLALVVRDSTVTVDRTRITGTTRADTSQFTLRASQLDGNLATDSSTVVLDDVSVAQTSTAIPHVLVRSRLDIFASWVQGMLVAEGGVVNVRRSRWSLSHLGPQPGGLVASYARVSVVSTLFDFGERPPAPSIVELLFVARHGRTSLEDVVCAGPSISDPDVHVGCVALISGPSSERHTVRRLLLVGGSTYPQFGALGSVDTQDLSAFGGPGGAVSVTGGTVSLSRLEIGRSHVGVHAGGGESALDLVTRDLVVADASARAVILRDGITTASAHVDMGRVWIAGGRGGAAGLSVRSSGMGAESSLDAALRDIMIESQHAVGLELGLDVRLSLRSFVINGAGTALAFRASVPRPNRRHHLAYGTLRATVQAIDIGGTEEEVFTLLDHVRVDAPRLLAR